MKFDQQAKLLARITNRVRRWRQRINETIRDSNNSEVYTASKSQACRLSQQELSEACEGIGSFVQLEPWLKEQGWIGDHPFYPSSYYVTDKAISEYYSLPPWRKRDE